MKVRHIYNHDLIIDVLDIGENYYFGYSLPNKSGALEAVGKSMYEPVPDPNQQELWFP